MVVEDGTGLENADSYVSVEFADDYFSARGVSAWKDIEDEAKEQCLVRATDYIDNMFRWYGKKMSASQALRFPRTNLKDYEGSEITGIPTCLKQAVCDAAMIAVDGSELFHKDNENGDVVSENITSLSFTYSRTKRETADKTLYDSVNTKLRGLYVDTGKSRILVGKVERL